MNISFTIVNFILVGIAIFAVDRADGVDPCEKEYSCCLSQSGSCPSLCDSFLKNSSDTRVCYKDHGNEITTDNISNGIFKIDGEVVNTKNLQNCAKGCNGSESGASKLHAGVVGVLLGSIALAFMS